jgi:hypothetical protein
MSNKKFTEEEIDRLVKFVELLIEIDKKKKNGALLEDDIGY